MVKADRPFCPYAECGKQFYSSCNLSRHIKVARLGVRHACSVCGKELTSMQSLRDHLNVHTGQHPYTCDFEGCTRVFKQANQLAVHRRAHRNSSGRSEDGMESSQLEQFRQGTAEYPFLTLPKLPSLSN